MKLECCQCAVTPSVVLVRILRRETHPALCPVIPRVSLFSEFRKRTTLAPWARCLCGTCAAHSSEDAPFSEAAPFSEELTGVSLLPVSSRPSAVSGTIRDIFLRRVDPPCTTAEKRKIPAQRANRLRATELKKEVPVRRVGPLGATELREEASTVRSNPLYTTELTRKIPVKIRRLIQSCPTGLKGVVPIRKVIQSCAASAPGSKGVVPIKR